jgi:phenylalanyl-tRNA synthetase beta chain
VKVLLSWIREFVDVPGSPEEIGARMSMRGLALEGIDRVADDAVLDFDVTSNRPDCLSIIGIAREIATVYGLALKQSGTVTPQPGQLFSGVPNGPTITVSNTAEIAGDGISVRIEDPELCGRYVAAIADVKIGPSPAWMQARLIACGIRPISNVVDITNYVLLELGHPMHAFDIARLAGPAIVVRRARAGEPLTTLDGKPRTLSPDMLAIADAERACALAGVMGGGESEVSDRTERIVLESAWFKPQSVRATSKRLGLRTEASYRFERGADLTAPDRAMTRALDLIESTGAGTRRGEILDCYPRPYEPRELLLDAAAIARLLGMDVPVAEIERILRSLGFRLRALGGWQAAAPDAATTMGRAGNSWRVAVPGWRVDVQRPVDLIEEVGRHHGFEHLPSTFPGVEQAPAASDARIARDARLRRAMLGMGFSEAVTFAFIDGASAEPFVHGLTAVTLANPLSEKFTTLRPSLLPGVIDAVSHNRRHGRRDIRLFEIGTRFSAHGEVRSLAAAWTGLATSEHWSGGARQVDFFDVKGVVEQLCASMRIAPRAVAVDVPYLVAGRSMSVRAGDVELGVAGQLDPAIAAQRQLPEADAIYVLELSLDAMTKSAPGAATFARPLPRHPSVVRDLSIVVSEALSAETVRGTIRSAGPAALVDVREFDRYHGKGIAEGKVSLSLRLTFQALERTLTDAEVNLAMDQILAALNRDLDAVQR